MKKLIYFKENIEGLSDVAETVKVIEKKAASQIHLLRKEVEDLRNYREECRNVLKRLSYFYWDNKNPLLKSGESKKELIVVTSDKGIVGGLYHLIIEKLLEVKKDYQIITVIGAKGLEYLNEEEIKPNTVPVDLSYFPNPEEIEKLTNYFFSAYKKEGRIKIDILYPQFITTAYQQPILKKFLPFDFGEEEFIGNSKHNETEGLPIFEGSKIYIFDELLKRFINVYFTEIYIESKLSEFSARTIEAENATQKTKELIGKANIEYFKERRKIITQKQLESFTVHRSV